VTQFFRKLFNPSSKQKAEEIPLAKPHIESSEVFVNSPSYQDEQTLDTAKQEKKSQPVELQKDRMVAAIARSVGMQRDHNEDSSFSMTAMLANEQRIYTFGLYIVADGMGGHMHGELASGIAVKSVSHYLIRNLFMPLVERTNQDPDTSLLQVMQAACKEAHQTIASNAPGGGTTLTAVLILGDQVMIAHIGDSRAYRITPPDGIQALTRDHSLVRKLIEIGQITSDQAAYHPQRNVLYRALGQGEYTEADIQIISRPNSGYLLICSDGLWGLVDESELLRMVTTSSTPQEACQSLVEAANAAGGPDNITAMVVQFIG
jgi:serine/threonine protein phosphatase PrpC